MKLIIGLLLTLTLVSCSVQQEADTSQAEKEESTEIQEDTTPYQELYPSGQIKITGQMLGENRHGRWVSYFKNGLVWSETEYFNGQKSGKCSGFFDNGMMRFKGAYVNNLKQSAWHFYDKDGALVKTVVYHRGEIKEP